MKTTLKITGNVSLALLGMGTVLKIFHWPGASPALLLGFVLLCFIFFPSAIYLNHKEFKAKGRTALNVSILIGGIVLMIGILFKVMHWPGASFLLFTGWSIVVGVFLPVLLFVKIREVSTTKEKVVYVLGVIALMIFEAATMFKMFHWPGATFLMVIGAELLMCFFLPMYTFIRLRESGKITGQFIFIITTSMYAIALTVLLSFATSSNVIGHFVNGASNSAKILSYFEKKNKQWTVSDSLHTKTDTLVLSIAEEADKVHQLIVSIKLNLVQTVDQVDEPTARMCISNPDQIVASSNYDAGNIVLLGSGGNGLATALKQALENFRKKAVQASSSNPGLSKNIETFLSTSPVQNETGSNTWEEANFRNKLLIGTIVNLSTIEKNVRIVETLTIEDIQHKTNSPKTL